MLASSLRTMRSVSTAALFTSGSSPHGARNGIPAAPSEWRIRMLSSRSLAASAFVILCAFSLTRAAAADLSEPKAAAKKFVTALAAHDLATLRDASTGTDEEHQRIEAMSDLIVAQRKYGDS